MPDHQPTRIFISYSRADSDFVDRLEADLRARGFDTWVDRRRLEGGQEWQREIEHAIDRSDLMIVVLSREAADSEWVQFEWERALESDKAILPLIYRPCTVPFALEARRQTKSLIGVGDDRRLIVILDDITRLTDPASALPTDLRELYRRASDANHQGDLELAARLLQRIVDLNPNYASGQPVDDLASVNARLLPIRVQRLKQEAQDARRVGQYGREAGALKAILGLAPSDEWAQEYLPVAETNSKNFELYLAAQDSLDANRPNEAAERLTRLWQKENAPYFRDPKGLAPTLGLRVPPTYEEVREQRAAKSRSANERKAAEERARAARREAEERLKQEQLVRQTGTKKMIAFAQAVRLVPIVLALLSAIVLALGSVPESPLAQPGCIIPLTIALAVGLLVLDSWCMSARTRLAGIWLGAATSAIIASLAFALYLIVVISSYPSADVLVERGVSVFETYTNLTTSLIVYLVAATAIAAMVAIGAAYAMISQRRSNSWFERRLAEIEAHYQRELAEIAQRYDPS